MTTFGDMVYAMGGVPLLPGIPFGRASRPIFVAPGTGAGGSDGNNGKRPNQALATLAKAVSLATADHNDTVYMLASSNTAANTTDALTTSLLWNKDGVHLIGVNAGQALSPRSRIGVAATATAASVAPLVTWSANGCYVKNIQIISELADAAAIGGMLVSGNRNHFVNCHIASCATTTQDVATQYSLKVTGSENLFEDCTIGIDTIARGAGGATYEMQLASGATRNIFRNCLILSYAGAAGMGFLDVPATGIDRFALFENCIFANAIQSAATTMTEALHVAAGTSPSGLILLRNCTLVGATDWESNTESGRVYIDGAAPTNNTSGLAVVVEAT